MKSFEILPPVNSRTFPLGGLKNSSSGFYGIKLCSLLQTIPDISSFGKNRGASGAASSCCKTRKSSSTELSILSRIS
jgi:hypothetical protein